MAPPGGVMLSQSTARLVDGVAALGEPEMVQIKGAVEPVPTCRLLGMGQPRHAIRRAQSELVGRRWELSKVEGLLDRAIEGRGAVACRWWDLAGGSERAVWCVRLQRWQLLVIPRCSPPSAGTRHVSQVPFQAVARLLRSATGIEGLTHRMLAPGSSGSSRRRRV